MNTASTIQPATRSVRPDSETRRGPYVEFSAILEKEDSTKPEQPPRHREATDLVVSLEDRPTFILDLTEVGVTVARWEGVVQDIDEKNGTMSVILRSKSGLEPDHAAEIFLSEVSDDDRDLLEEGAVFYLEQSKRHHRRTLILTQSLSFRRLPAWTPTMIKAVEEKGAAMRQRFKQPLLAGE